MRSSRTALAIVLALGLGSGAARADTTIVKTDDFDLRVGAHAQTLAHMEHVNDADRDDLRMYLFQKAARLRLNGGNENFRFFTELAVGGENTVITGTGIGIGLLDFAADIKLGPGESFVRVGQFKVPYGRENLTYSGQMLFSGRSAQNLGFIVGRDVGATYNLKLDGFTAIAGVFTGGGRDVPERYLPEKIGIPLLVARVGYGNVDDDLYALDQKAGRPDGLRWGVFANALYTKDSVVGHSSALNVKFADKSLLLNGNWNPYIGQQPLDQGTWYQAGIDAAVKMPLGSDMALAGELEVNHAAFTNTYGSLAISGARAQGAFTVGNLDLALRYGVLLPDAKFAFAGRQIVNADPIHEVTPSLTYRINGDALKIIADAPLLFGAPVMKEAGVGSYVLTSQPGQTSYLGKEANSVQRMDVQQARLMLQAWF